MSSWQVNKQCKDCPWRKDVPTGKFSPERFRKLRGSVEQGFAPMFACHNSTEENKKACVGYVVNQAFVSENGPENFNLRLMLGRKEIDPERMTVVGPQFLSYDEMSRANGVDDASEESDSRAEREDAES